MTGTGAHRCPTTLIRQGASPLADRTLLTRHTKRCEDPLLAGVLSEQRERYVAGGGFHGGVRRPGLRHHPGCGPHGAPAKAGGGAAYVQHLARGRPLIGLAPKAYSARVSFYISWERHMRSTLVGGRAIAGHDASSREEARRGGLWCFRVLETNVCP